MSVDHAGHVPVDGQIDLFTGTPPETIEYAARHTTPAGDVAVIGPLRTIDGAQRAGEHNTGIHGGRFEIVSRRVTQWEVMP